MMKQGYHRVQAGQGADAYGEDPKKNISPALLIPDNPYYIMYPQPGAPGLYPMPSTYPQGYPPNMYGQIHGMPQAQQPPKKSAMPMVGFILGTVAMVVGILMVIEGVVYMNMNSYMLNTGICCLAWLFFAVTTIACSVLGIIFSALAIGNIKKKKIVYSPLAKVGLILSIISIPLMALSLVLIIYRILYPPEYSGGEIFIQILTLLF